MKTIILFLFAVIAFSSCKRHYVCICEQSTSQGMQVVSQHGIQATKANAETECKQFEDNTVCYPHR